MDSSAANITLDPKNLTAIVSVITALSVASERLVEITKGVVPWLDQKKTDEKEEGQRCAAIHALAVVAGLVTAYLAQSYVDLGLGQHKEGWFVMGLLASGGSGFWNSIQTYVSRVKDMKKS